MFDEVFVNICAKRHYFWLVVDQYSKVVDVFLLRRRH